MNWNAKQRSTPSTTEFCHCHREWAQDDIILIVTPSEQFHGTIFDICQRCCWPV